VTESLKEGDSGGTGLHRRGLENHLEFGFSRTTAVW
jgi:hypothetical protein